MAGFPPFEIAVYFFINKHSIAGSISKMEVPSEEGIAPFLKPNAGLGELLVLFIKKYTAIPNG